MAPGNYMEKYSLYYYKWKEGAIKGDRSIPRASYCNSYCNYAAADR